MDRTTNNNPSNRTIFFIIERINSPPFTGRPFKSHAIYFPFVFSYLVRSISKSFIGARFLPRLFTPASSLFDETISKLNEISKARSKVYEQGDRGRTINVIPTRDRKLYLFNGARFARFSSPSRESTRDGERKRIILATLFRRPDQIPIFFAFGSRNIGRKGDSDSTPVQIEFRFSILSRLVVPRTMRENNDRFFFRITQAFVSFLLQRNFPSSLACGYIGFFESSPRIAILSRDASTFYGSFFFMR